MKIQVGYDLSYYCPQETPMILMLNIHHSRSADIIVPDRMTTDPVVPVRGHHDSFGNWCTRITAPVGRIRISSMGMVRDAGELDPVVESACQHNVQDLPDDALVYLLGSRYCETELLSQTAWNLFAG